MVRHSGSTTTMSGGPRQRAWLASMRKAAHTPTSRQHKQPQPQPQQQHGCMSAPVSGGAPSGKPGSNTAGAGGAPGADFGELLSSRLKSMSMSMSQSHSASASWAPSFSSEPKAVPQCAQQQQQQQQQDDDGDVDRDYRVHASATATPSQTESILSAMQSEQLFHQVEATGVIKVMSRAQSEGFFYGSDEWTNLGQGAPEVGQLPRAPRRRKAATLDEVSNEYASIRGVSDLCEAVAHLYNERYRVGKASKYTAENVCIVPGGRAGLARLASLLPNAPVGFFVPEYTAWGGLLSVFSNCQPIMTERKPSKGYSIDRADLEREIRERRLRIVINSNPCNPTGQVIEGDELARYLQVGRDTNCFMVMDEFYSSYIYGEDGRATGRTVSAAEHVRDVNSDPVLILDGLTKNFRCPGWRIGWFVGPKSLIRSLSGNGSFMDGGANHPLQNEAIDMLQPDVARADTLALQEHFAAKRRYVLTRLRDMGLTVDVPPRATFYIWVNLSELPQPLNDADAFFEAALRRKVIVVPGHYFDISPSVGGEPSTSTRKRHGDHVRLSYGPPLPELERGLNALEALLADARRTTTSTTSTARP